MERLANDDRWRKKELGDLRARLFNLRLSQMLAAVTLEDVRNLPGTIMS